MQDETTTIVIMGASGDLTRRKLIPALYNLSRRGRLPADFNIVGMSRTVMTNDEFRDRMWKGVLDAGEPESEKDVWKEFAQNVFYCSGNLGTEDGRSGLEARLRELEGDTSVVNRLFFLSVAPQLYESAVIGLGDSGMAEETTGWRRVVIEKPFGWDLESAQTLNKVVNGVFDESRVYRIDHYLGKETVQNLMVFRFANAIFEPIWNRNYVDNVQITVAEKVPVGDRAAYYDDSGVVRDMVQNHLLQLLTIVGMEPPSSMESGSLRNMKVDVLKAIRKMTPEEASGQAVRGQYRGYKDENGVPADSNTATYAALRLFIDNWRWQGVPFYLRSGKALKGKVSQVVIQFHRPPHILFPDDPHHQFQRNNLTLMLEPNEGVHLNFQVKVPDTDMGLRPMDMEFHYGSAFMDENIPEAYQRLLQDAIDGDPSLFIRSDQIEEAWRIVDPLIDSWARNDVSPLHLYENGSEGPVAADELLKADGRRWVTVWDHLA